MQTVETLARVFDMALRLLHPFTPFVTEELWGHLRQAILASPAFHLASDWPEALIVARWPNLMIPRAGKKSKVADFELIQEIVRSIRNFRAGKERSTQQTHRGDHRCGCKIGFAGRTIQGTGCVGGLE